ncbi:MAG TPA: hypothetical protein VJ754_07430, partial [Anaerolineae bacterium]|nr:hypothetical protein [Anaerolineae bacterium]
MKTRLTHTLERGTPFEAHGRLFVPEARVTTFAGREIQASVGSTQARGLQVRRVQPTALIEQTPGGERRYRIREGSARRRLGCAAAALAPLVANALVNRLIARRK